MNPSVVIIGAGVIGLAIAAELSSQVSCEMYVLERNYRAGMETSSRNSEVIHSGIYYPQGSLKAQLCVEGKELLYDICQVYGIPFKRIGKLIVAAVAEEVPYLENLFANGEKNGVHDLQWWDADKLKKEEPNITGLSAIFSPSTGIIDSHSLIDWYLARAKAKGVTVCFQTEVIGIKRSGKKYLVDVEQPSGPFSLEADFVINAAGLFSDKIAASVGLNIEQAKYRLHYCKGEYYSVSPRAKTKVNKLIYPVPPQHNAGLGIHVTLDLQGQMRLGPSAYYVDTIDYGIDGTNKKLFFDSVKRFLPHLDINDIEPGYTGIRPKLTGPQEKFRDFVVADETDRNFPGLFNLIGIESPGLTSSPAIARHVVSGMKGYF